MNQPVKYAYLKPLTWSQSWMQMPVRDRKIFGLLLLTHFVLTIIYIRFQGVIFDEPDYFRYAIAWLKGHPERLEPIMDSKTPLVAVSLVPALFKWLLPERLMQEDYYVYLKAGRPFMYLYQALGMFTMYCWTKRLWGGLRWFLPVLFYSFDPLIFSYGMFIGSDMPSTSLLLALIYRAWRYQQTGERRYWWRLCILAGLSVVLKASLLYCYPLLLLVFCIAIPWRQLSLRRSAIHICQFIFIQVLVINAAYYFKGSFSSLGGLHFDSRLFAHLQHSFSFAGGAPVPFPAAFLQGIDMLQLHAETGGGFTNSNTYQGVFIAGKFSLREPVWYYYLANAAFKWPLFTWLALLTAAGRLLWMPHTFSKLRQQVWCWLPALYFLVILSGLNKFQIGIRHSMLLLPFVYLCAGSSYNWLYDKKRWLFLSLALLHLVSVARFFPNLVAYTNEFIVQKKYVYRWLRDSSIDYGQAKPMLRSFLRQHPEYRQPDNRPDTGYFALTVSDLFTEMEGPSRNIAWLRTHFQPFDHYRYSILLFRITAQDLQRAGLSRQVLQEGDQPRLRN